MRYFWHAIITIVVISLIVFLFFVFSVRVNDNITFTDEIPAITTPTITIADPQSGPVDAPVTIVNFGDYGCEDCADAETALADLSNAYPGKIRIVWKDMPNTSLHPEALNAAMAARCVKEQEDEAFFPYHAYLFANQADLGPELYAALAAQMGLKESVFNRCLEGEDTYALVQKSYEEGLALRINATPTLFINGERYTGAISRNQLEAKIRAFIK